MKKILGMLSLLICGTTLATPMPAQPSAPPEQAAMAAKPDFRPSPLDRLRVGVQSLMLFMNQEPIPAPTAVARYLDENIVPLFDFESMAREAGGRYYYALDPQSRAEMADEIKELFLTRLTLGLAAYEGQKVRFLRPRLSPDRSEASVGMLILNPGHYPARIDFRLSPRGNDWLITDLAANGTSAVVYYRQKMAREMARRTYQRYQRLRDYRARPRW